MTPQRFPILTFANKKLSTGANGQRKPRVRVTGSFPFQVVRSLIQVESDAVTQRGRRRVPGDVGPVTSRRPRQGPPKICSKIIKNLKTFDSRRMARYFFKTRKRFKIMKYSIYKRLGFPAPAQYNSFRVFGVRILF